MPRSLSIFSSSSVATSRIGASLARYLKKGDVVLMRGDIGAGKTAFCRGLLQVLTGEPDLHPPSPTYMLSIPYDAPSLGCMVHHMDLYRFEDADVTSFGCLDLASAFEHGISAIEWSEHLPSALTPSGSLVVHVDVVGESSRNFFFTPHGNSARWDDGSMQSLANALEGVDGVSPGVLSES